MVFNRFERFTVLSSLRLCRRLCDSSFFSRLGQIFLHNTELPTPGTKYSFKHEWQGRQYVLSWFGRAVGEARRAYLRYMEEGVRQGRRPDLVGGGLVRSYGGWSAVLSLRRRGKEAETTDARVLGRGDFVERVLREGARWNPHPMKQKEWRGKIGKIVEDRCLEKGVNVGEVRMGSRRGPIPEVRAEVVEELVKKLGVPLAEIAWVVGISTSAVSKILGRRENNST
jgi:putative transposase